MMTSILADRLEMALRRHDLQAINVRPHVSYASSQPVNSQMVGTETTEIVGKHMPATTGVLPHYATLQEGLATPLPADADGLIELHVTDVGLPLPGLRLPMIYCGYIIQDIQQHIDHYIVHCREP